MGELTNDPDLVARVDAEIRAIEDARGGSVHPIRSIPIDMIARAVANEHGQRPASASLRLATIRVVSRFEGGPAPAVSDRESIPEIQYPLI